MELGGVLFCFVFLWLFYLFLFSLSLSPSLSLCLSLTFTWFELWMEWMIQNLHFVLCSTIDAIFNVYSSEINSLFFTSFYFFFFPWGISVSLYFLVSFYASLFFILHPSPSPSPHPFCCFGEKKRRKECKIYYV